MIWVASGPHETMEAAPSTQPQEDVLALEIVPPLGRDTGTSHPGMPQNPNGEWTMDDYAVLADTVPSALDAAEVASRMGRTVPEVEAAAARLIAPDVAPRLAPGAHLNYLRGVLLDPDYPWLRHVATSYEGYVPPWPMGGDRALMEFWERGDRLEFIADSLGVSEVQAAGRCVALGLAANFAEVTETLGPGREGVVEMRGRMAFEREDVELDVYVDVSGADSIFVYLAPPGQGPLRGERLRPDGSEHCWMVVRGAVCGEVQSSP